MENVEDKNKNSSGVSKEKTVVTKTVEERKGGGSKIETETKTTTTVKTVTKIQKKEIKGNIERSRERKGEEVKSYRSKRIIKNNL